MELSFARAVDMGAVQLSMASAVWEVLGIPHLASHIEVELAAAEAVDPSP